MSWKRNATDWKRNAGIHKYKHTGIYGKICTISRWSEHCFRLHNLLLQVRSGSRSYSWLQQVHWFWEFPKPMYVTLLKKLLPRQWGEYALHELETKFIDLEAQCRHPQVPTHRNQLEHKNNNSVEPALLAFTQPFAASSFRPSVQSHAASVTFVLGIPVTTLPPLAHHT